MTSGEIHFDLYDLVCIHMCVCGWIYGVKLEYKHVTIIQSIIMCTCTVHVLLIVFNFPHDNREYASELIIIIKEMLIFLHW